VADLDFTSSPNDLIAAEAAVLAQNIDERDISSQPNGRPSSVYQNDDRDVLTDYGSLGHSTEGSPSPGRRKRMQDLRPEVPLLPIDGDRPPKRTKTVQFSDELLAVIPDRIYEDPTQDSEFRDDMDLLMTEVSLPAHQQDSSTPGSKRLCCTSSSIAVYNKGLKCLLTSDFVLSGSGSQRSVRARAD